MIRAKRIYDQTERGDGLRILVDRLWPRGMSKDRAAVGLWLKDVAPSDSLRRWFGHKPDRWAEFKARYYRELDGNCEVVAELRKQARKGSITVLFSAKDEGHNNAVALVEYLQQ